MGRRLSVCVCVCVCVCLCLCHLLSCFLNKVREEPKGGAHLLTILLLFTSRPHYKVLSSHCPLSIRGGSRHRSHTISARGIPGPRPATKPNMLIISTLNQES